MTTPKVLEHTKVVCPVEGVHNKVCNYLWEGDNQHTHRYKIPQLRLAIDSDAIYPIHE
jgi:hypothetical protein